MSSRRVESFLLRLVVHEAVVSDTQAWQGRVQHVGSGYERQFERLSDLIAFIGEQICTDHSLVITCDEVRPE
jgi:hypothetical protein